MSFQEYFTDSDKPYAENLNDALALVDAFDLTVPVKLPDMFSNGEFSSSLNMPRKCNISIVTLKSVDSGVTVGISSISGSGEVIFRVYPNFNCFYKWNKLILEKSGTVSVGFKKTDGTSISASVGSDGTISEASALKELQEIDVVFTLTNATINSILIEFINNQSSSRVRSGALLEASQLANVDGTVSSGETKAVNGDTVKTALDNLQSTVNEDIEDLSDTVDELGDAINEQLDLKESLANKVTTLDNSNTNYPSSNAVKSVTDIKEDKSNKVTTLDSSDEHYPSSKAVKTVTDGKENKLGWVLKESNANYEIRVLNDALVEYILHTEGTLNITNAPQTLNNWIPEGYRPPYTLSAPINHGSGFIAFRSDGAIGYWTMTSNYRGKLNGTAYWRKQ